LIPLGYDPDWIVQRTGIRERRRAPDDWATSDVALEAAKACLSRCAVEASELDLILVATVTPDTFMPSTACNLQQRLGAVAPAMDINAACAGFLYALVTGMQFVHSGSCRRVLVVGADLMTRTVNPLDHKTYPLFGDGAGAVLLGPGKSDQGLLACTLGSEGDLGASLSIPAGGSREAASSEALAAGRQFVHMDGRSVFKWAVRVIQDATNDVLIHAGLTVADLDLVLLHQANSRIIDAAVDGLGVERSRVVTNLERYGNTSAASVPMVLAEAAEAGRIARGDRVLMLGFGAGLAWGAAVMQW
jgi:3-oxoacyl-[acyl-carrier-protein] synthase-3